MMKATRPIVPAIVPAIVLAIAAVSPVGAQTVGAPAAQPASPPVKGVLDVYGGSGGARVPSQAPSSQAKAYSPYPGRA
jgi:hypothetical protein